MKDSWGSQTTMCSIGALWGRVWEKFWETCVFVFLPCLGDEFHPSKAVFRRLYMCIYIYMYTIYVNSIHKYMKGRHHVCFFYVQKLEVKEVIPDDLNESSNFITQNHMILSFWYRGDEYLLLNHETSQSKNLEYNDSSGQIIIIHQPRFPWNKRFPLLTHHLGWGRVRSL